jgi:hypothetical protein
VKYALTVVVLVGVLVPSAFAVGQARDPRVPKMQSQIRQLQTAVSELASRRALTDLEVVAQDVPFSAAPSKASVIRCPAGKRVIGGGAVVDGRDPDVAALTKSGPWDQGSWWVAGYQLPRDQSMLPAGSTLWGIHGYAICATLQGTPSR